MTDTTTFTVPRQTLAPGSSYVIKLNTVTYGDLVYSTPYLAVKAIKTTPPVTSYITLPVETITIIPPPITISVEYCPLEPS